VTYEVRVMCGPPWQGLGDGWSYLTSSRDEAESHVTQAQAKSHIAFVVEHSDWKPRPRRPRDMRPVTNPPTTMNRSRFGY